MPGRKGIQRCLTVSVLDITTAYTQNETFSSSSTGGFTAGTSTTISNPTGNQLHMTATWAAKPIASTTVYLVNGRSYRFNLDIVSFSVVGGFSHTVRVRVLLPSATIQNDYTTTGTKSITFTSNTTGYVTFDIRSIIAPGSGIYSGNPYINIDNFNVGYDSTFTTNVTTCTLDPNGYRYGFNGKENIDEVKGQGNWQDYGERMYDTRLARFSSPDPLIIYGRKFPELSSYQFASNTPIQAIDLDGLEALLYFDKSAKILIVHPDMSTNNPELPDKNVTAKEYNELTPEMKATANYSIVVRNVFSGGHSDENGNVEYQTNSAELPIAAGTYNILENKGNTNPAHNSFFVLDPQDESPYDKVDDRPGQINASGQKRSGYNLHPGTISHGCVTVDLNAPNSTEEERAEEWSIINKAITGTTTEVVDDNRGIRKYNPFATQIKYGKMIVVE